MLSHEAAVNDPALRAPSLTGPQQAAVAKLGFAAGGPGAVALLCGPAGVGKTLVLRGLASGGLPAGHAVRLDRWSDRSSVRGSDPLAFPGAGAGGLSSATPTLLLIDDADRATVTALAECVERWAGADDPPAIVLAGRGRLLTLVAGDARLERSVRLRATLPAFTCVESRLLLDGRRDGGLAARCATGQAEAVSRTIHEIAGGIPALVSRIADIACMLADSRPGRGLVPDDIETIHRRLCLTAA